ncbi:hypothetical protein B0H17DRAFT_1186195 [Mycena rosella]|uniref:Uncharacterized protein n=1 Tax=Mycena rosella TaxID=1033263 RepID=A0AAD7CN52_MYCRO|nr:hypothetical protein B0H17DRAFT_1186195 [Mycena rosella]
MSTKWPLEHQDSSSYFSGSLLAVSKILRLQQSHLAHGSVFFLQLGACPLFSQLISDCQMPPDILTDGLNCSSTFNAILRANFLYRPQQLLCTRKPFGFLAIDVSLRYWDTVTRVAGTRSRCPMDPLIRCMQFATVVYLNHRQTFEAVARPLPLSKGPTPSPDSDRAADRPVYGDGAEPYRNPYRNQNLRSSDGTCSDGVKLQVSAAEGNGISTTGENALDSDRRAYESWKEKYVLSLTRNLGTLGTWALAKYMHE